MYSYGLQHHHKRVCHHDNGTADSNSIGGPVISILMGKQTARSFSTLKIDLFTSLKCGKPTFHCGDMVVTIIDVVVITVEENGVCVAAVCDLCCVDPKSGIFGFSKCTDTC